MISKNTIKFIKSLQIKKYRKKESAFLVEGAKNVLELLNSDFKIAKLYTTSAFSEEYNDLLKLKFPTFTIVEIETLSTISSFKNNNSALAIVKMPTPSAFTINKDEYGIVLQDIRDPGNLGTIVRIADWYGIKKIVCSTTSADFYNPKVIAATMGSFTRVQVAYEILNTFIPTLNLPLIGTFLSGESVHDFNFPKSGLILIGNESTGIGKAIEQLVNCKVSIPAYGGAESLNAGIATAIVCDNLRRSLTF